MQTGGIAGGSPFDGVDNIPPIILRVFDSFKRMASMSTTEDSSEQFRVADPNYQRDVIKDPPPSNELIETLSVIAGVSKDQASAIANLYYSTEGLDFKSDTFKQGIADGTLSFKTIMASAVNYMKTTFDELNNEVAGSGDEFYESIRSGTNELSDVFSSIGDTLLNNIVDNSKVPGYGTEGGTGSLYTDIPNNSIRIDHNNYITPEGERRTIATVPGFQRGIVETDGPQHAIIGEAGAEAVVPLEGKNKERGRSILHSIIPKHFPEMAMQTGGIIGDRGGSVIDSDIEKFKDIMLKIGQYIHEIFEKFNIDIIKDIINPIKKPIEPVRQPVDPGYRMPFEPPIKAPIDCEVMKDIEEGLRNITDIDPIFINPVEQPIIPPYFQDPVERPIIPPDFKDPIVPIDKPVINPPIEDPIMIPPFPPFPPFPRYPPYPSFPPFPPYPSLPPVEQPVDHPAFPDPISPPAYPDPVPPIGGPGEPIDIPIVKPIKGLLATLKEFKDNNYLQLQTLVGEFTVDQEDLEIDDTEFAARVKEGSLSFKAIMLNIGQYLHTVLGESANNLNEIIPSAAEAFKTIIKESADTITKAGNKLKKAIDDVTPIHVYHHVSIRHSYSGGDANEGVPGAAHGVKETRGTQLTTIGEAGAEAVIPLEGKNKKYGESILSYILPKYFGMGMERGGVVGSGDEISIGESTIASQVPIDILSTLKSFKESVTSQLNNLLAEFSIGQEDLEIDAEEFAERVKDGSLSFKAILMNIGMYMHATFQSVMEIIKTAGSSFSVNVTASMNTFSSGLTTFNTNLTTLLSKIETMITDSSNLNNKHTDMITAIDGVITKLDNLDFSTSNKVDEDKNERETPLIDATINVLNDLGDRFPKLQDIAPRIFGSDDESNDSKKSGDNSPSVSTQDEIKPFVNSVTKFISDINRTRDNPPLTPTKKPFSMWAEGGVVKSPSLGMFGEAGAEAIIPLEGKNKKFGETILNTIIPQYYPEMLNANGAIYGGDSYNRSVTHSTGDSYAENYNIMGPVNVASQDPIDFMNRLKTNYRASPRR